MGRDRYGVGCDLSILPSKAVTTQRDDGCLAGVGTTQVRRIRLDVGKYCTTRGKEVRRSEE